MHRLIIINNYRKHMVKIHGFLGILELLLSLEYKEVVQYLTMHVSYSTGNYLIFVSMHIHRSSTLCWSKHWMQTLWCSWRTRKHSSFKVIIWCQGIADSNSGRQSLYNGIQLLVATIVLICSSLSETGGWLFCLNSKPVWKQDHGVWCAATTGNY